jgi:tetratricopeptide (TPR) repeat protein
MRLPDRAMECYDRSLAIRNDALLVVDMVMTSLRFNGHTATARRLLARATDAGDPVLNQARARIAFLDREFAKAAETYRGVESTSPSVRGYFAAAAAVSEYLGGSQKARAVLEDAASQVEAVLRDSPGNPSSRADLALIYAFLGRADEAVAQAKLAVDLTAKDKYTAGVALEGLAMVYARTGRADAALDLIEQLLAVRYEDPLTIATLREDARWDPLRDHPRFKDILKRSS